MGERYESRDAAEAAARAKSTGFYREDIELTARRAKIRIGIIHNPRHDHAWIIAMSDKASSRTTLEL
ncbi:hypothetical protein G4G93_29990 [Methylobacterium sp. DB0501]|uniref:hypothetical protein n=1 Tax=Methylobacterium sp. DB0501 TaxID=2709665 RepID=UPI0013EB9409|nr:hypothetical protein [Methylobacterium sp. DB0501]NGM38085.1 hypothetical protein [Methylobacterium sp. DB0501]